MFSNLDRRSPARESVIAREDAAIARTQSSVLQPLMPPPRVYANRGSSGDSAHAATDIGRLGFSEVEQKLLRYLGTTIQAEEQLFVTTGEKQTIARTRPARISCRVDGETRGRILRAAAKDSNLLPHIHSLERAKAAFCELSYRGKGEALAETKVFLGAVNAVLDLANPSNNDPVLNFILLEYGATNLFCTDDLPLAQQELWNAMSDKKLARAYIFEHAVPIALRWKDKDTLACARESSKPVPTNLLLPLSRDLPKELGSPNFGDDGAWKDAVCALVEKFPDLETELCASAKQRFELLPLMEVSSRENRMQSNTAPKEPALCGEPMRLDWSNYSWEPHYAWGKGGIFETRISADPEAPLLHDNEVFEGVIAVKSTARYELERFKDSTTLAIEQGKTIDLVFSSKVDPDRRSGSTEGGTWLVTVKRGGDGSYSFVRPADAGSVRYMRLATPRESQKPLIHFLKYEADKPTKKEE